MRLELFVRQVSVAWTLTELKVTDTSQKGQNQPQTRKSSLMSENHKFAVRKSWLCDKLLITYQNADKLLISYQ